MKQTGKTDLCVFAVIFLLCFSWQSHQSLFVRELSLPDLHSTREAELVWNQPRLSPLTLNSLIFVSEDLKHFLASAWMNFTFALMILLQLHGSAMKALQKKWTKFLCPKFDSWRTHSITFHHNLSLNLHREDIDSPHTPTQLFFLHRWSTFWEKSFPWKTLWLIGCYNPVLKERERAWNNLRVYAKFLSLFWQIQEINLSTNIGGS